MNSTADAELSLLLALSADGGDNLSDERALLILRVLRRDLIQGKMKEARVRLDETLARNGASGTSLTDLLYADPLLVEILSAGETPADPLLARAAQILQGKFKTQILQKSLDRLDRPLLPLAALRLYQPGQIVDLAPLDSRPDRADAGCRFARALLELAQGRILPAVQRVFADCRHGLGALLLLFAAEQTGDRRWLELLLAESSADDDSFSLRIPRCLAAIALEQHPAETRLPLAMLNIGLPEILRRRGGEFLARLHLEEMLDRSDRLLDLGLDEAASQCLRELFASHRDDPEVLLKLSEVQERAGNHLQACRILTFLEKESPREVELKRRIYVNLRALGQNQRALAKLDDLLALTPDDPLALEAGMELAESCGRDDRMLDFARRLATRQADHLEAQRRIARAATGDERERAWLVCLRIAPEDAEAKRELERLRHDEKNRASRELVERARAEMDKGDHHRAEQLLRELVEVDPHCLPAWFQLAELLESKRRLDDALSILKQGACSDGAWHHPRLRSEAGRIALRLHRRRDALEILAELRLRRPEDWESRYRLLTVQREQAYRGELEASGTELLEQLHRDPGTADAFADFERGYILLFFPRFQQTETRENGLPLLDRVRRVRPDIPFLWDETLRGLLREDRPEEALKLHALMGQRGLETRPSLCRLVRYFLDTKGGVPEELLRQFRVLAPDDRMLGELFRQECSPFLGEKEMVRASDYVRRVRRECQTDKPLDLLRLGFTCLELADAARLTGDPVSQAVDAFKQVLTIQEDHHAALDGLVSAALSAPEILPDVERHLNQALERRPDDPVLFALRGELLDRGFAAERKKEAGSAFEESLRLDFDQPRIHQGLASILRYLRQHEAATHHYMIALEMSKSPAMKEEAVRALNWLRRARSQ